MRISCWNNFRCLSIFTFLVKHKQNTVVEEFFLHLSRLLVKHKIASLDVVIVDSKPIKANYNFRTEVERYFSRLKSRKVEEVSQYKYRSIRS